jgi:ribosomal protein S26
MGKTPKFYTRGWEHSKTRGREHSVNCSFCGRLVPKYKTFPVVRGFRITDPVIRNALSGNQFFSAQKMHACPACARYQRIVRKKR